MSEVVDVNEMNCLFDPFLSFMRGVFFFESLVDASDACARKSKKSSSFV